MTSPNPVGLYPSRQQLKDGVLQNLVQQPGEAVDKAASRRAPPDGSMPGGGSSKRSGMSGRCAVGWASARDRRKAAAKCGVAKFRASDGSTGGSDHISSYLCTMKARPLLTACLGPRNERIEGSARTTRHWPRRTQSNSQGSARRASTQIMSNSMHCSYRILAA